jgi:hypothetical protein
MKFDSLEAVLLGDEAWACELTMDELAFVGGGYGSGYAGPAPAEAYVPQTDGEWAAWFASYSGERMQAQGVTSSVPNSGMPTFSIGGGGYKPSAPAPYMPPCPPGWSWDGGKIVATTGQGTTTSGQIGTESHMGAGNSSNTSYSWGCTPPASTNSSSSGYSSAYSSSWGG